VSRHRRKRVIHLTTVDMSLAYLLLPQLIAFRDAGYEVIGMSAPGPHVQRIEAEGIQHVAIANSTRSVSPMRDIAAAAEVYRHFRRLRPDIVHTHNPKPGIYGRIAARAARVPAIVNTVHGLYAQPEDPWRRRAAVYALERLAAMCSDAELIQNPEDVAVLARLGIPEDKLHLLRNGIDLDRFDPGRFDDEHRERVRHDWGVGDDEVVVGLVGRLVAEKGYREVFAAAKAVCPRHPDVRLVVIGPIEADKPDGLRQSEIEAASARGVRFLGQRDDVEQLYPAMDLYVLASWREGFPRSAMEAAAMGLPIVATDIRGCRQVVDHGQTGIIVPVRDSSSLAAAIERLAADRTLRRQLSAEARSKAVREFDNRRQIATTLSVYDSLLP
jgi:glycosyltransferase involved in cell wall biosynthesis